MDALTEMVTKLYQETEVQVMPSYPRVLVRVLPKEQMTKGGIMLPEHQQNKPTHEGVVLAVYKPFWKTIIKSDRENWERHRAQILVEIRDGEGKLEAEKVWIESPVKPGDHVLFPHMAIGIVPVWPLDDGKGDYRLVPDDQILSRLTYAQESTRDWLLGVVDLRPEALKGESVDMMLAAEVVDRILANADVIRKDVRAKAMSGA